jgi:hypothetical protein
LPKPHPSLPGPSNRDLFRRVRKDGTEAEEIKFNRDASSKVINYVTFSNITTRTAPLPPNSQALQRASHQQVQ